MCVGSGGSAKNDKNKDKKVKTNAQGAGTAMLGLLDAVTAAKTGGKVKKDSPAIGMTYGASPVGRNSNLPSGTILASNTGGGGGGGETGGEPLSGLMSGPLAQSQDQVDAIIARNQANPAVRQIPSATTPPITTPPVTTPTTTLPQDIVDALNKRKQTTYGPIGSAFSQMNPMLAAGGGSGQVFR
jgi:hypothetical protein